MSVGMCTFIKSYFGCDYKEEYERNTEIQSNSISGMRCVCVVIWRNYGNTIGINCSGLQDSSSGNPSHGFSLHGYDYRRTVSEVLVVECA